MIVLRPLAAVRTCNPAGSSAYLILIKGKTSRPTGIPGRGSHTIRDDHITVDSCNSMDKPLLQADGHLLRLRPMPAAAGPRAAATLTRIRLPSCARLPAGPDLEKWESSRNCPDVTAEEGTCW